MKCPSEIELNEYAEDRLATSRRWDVERHLHECPGCRTDLDGLTWATAALAGLHGAEPNEADHPSLEDLAALKDGKLSAAHRADLLTHMSACPECAHIYGQLPREQRERPLMRHWQPFAAAAAVLLVIGLVFLVNREGVSPGGETMVPIVRQAQGIRPPEAEAPTVGAPSAPAAPGASVKSTPSLPAAVNTPAGGRRAAERKRGTRSITQPPREHEALAVTADPPGTPERLPSDPATPEGARARGAGGPFRVTMAEAGRGGQPEAAPPLPAPSPADMPPFGSGGGGSSRATDSLEGRTGNVPQPRGLVCDKEKPQPGVAPMMQPSAAATAPASRAAPGGAATGVGGAPLAAKSVAPPPPTLNNTLRLDRRWLEFLKNDPQRKAQLKGLLRQMLK